MQQPTRDEYLTQEIRTASPQKLQLLMIDAAIRHAQRAKQFWAQLDDEQAGHAILRSQEIVAHLLAGLSIQSGLPLVRRIAAIYTFLIRSLTKAHLERDQEALNNVLRVLEIERETWQQVCQSNAGRSAHLAPTSPHFPLTTAVDADTMSQFSWHA
jgi:flagellar biosynthetic protein FliS